MKGRRVKQPCQKQRAVRVRRQRNGVHDHGCSNTTLLAQRDMKALDKPRTKATLRNFPHTIYYSVEDEVIGRRPKTQTAPDDRSATNDTKKNKHILTEPHSFQMDLATRANTHRVAQPVRG